MIPLSLHKRSEFEELLQIVLEEFRIDYVCLAGSLPNFCLPIR